MSGGALYLRKKLKMDKEKNILAVLSISLGVMIFVATAISTLSTKNYYNNYIGNRSSGADLIIRPKVENPLQITSDLQAELGIESIIPYAENEDYIETADGLSPVLMIDTDPQEEIKRQTLILAEGQRPQKEECLITEMLEKEYALSVGDSISVRNVNGERNYQISGVLKNSGTVTKNSFQCMVVDIGQETEMKAQEYRIALSGKQKLDYVKDQMATAIGKDYIITDANENSTSFDNELNIFFNIFYAVSGMLLLLGYYLMGITINHYLYGARKELAVLKVLGATKQELYSLLGKMGGVFCLTGSSLGLVLGFISARVMTGMIASLLHMGDIPLEIPYVAIFFAAICCIVGGFVIALLLAHRVARESIVDGLLKYPDVVEKENNQSTTFCLCVFCVTVGILGIVLKVHVLLSIILQISADIFLILITVRLFYPKFARLITQKIPCFPDYCKLIVRNNYQKNRKKNQRTVVLLALIITFITGLSCTFQQLNVTLNKLADYSYFGDAVVRSVSGASITNTDLDMLENREEVSEIYPLYQSYFDCNGVEIQLNGYAHEAQNRDQLMSFMDITTDEWNALEKPDSILLSDFVLQKCRLKIGDEIEVNGQKFTIEGSYASILNDGKSALIGMDGFLSAVSDYKIRYVNVVLNPGCEFDTFKKNFKNGSTDPYLAVWDVQEMKEVEMQADNQIIYLLYGILLIILFSALLIIINCMVSETRGNICSITILKALGLTRSQAHMQCILDGGMKAVFASATGGFCAILLNMVFVKALNNLLHWNLVFHLEIETLLLFIGIFMLITIYGGLITTKRIYRKISVVEAISME
ncbi:MAG: ABC transporter permease [Eubacteriales bacterium]|nr:ABC transporter permease [Eubacteriales bacterium]